MSRRWAMPGTYTFAYVLLTFAGALLIKLF